VAIDRFFSAVSDGSDSVQASQRIALRVSTFAGMDERGISIGIPQQSFSLRGTADDRAFNSNNRQPEHRKPRAG
jgi:hypothetical protein